MPIDPSRYRPIRLPQILGDLRPQPLDLLLRSPLLDLTLNTRRRKRGLPLLLLLLLLALEGRRLLLRSFGLRWMILLSGMFLRRTAAYGYGHFWHLRTLQPYEFSGPPRYQVQKHGYSDRVPCPASKKTCF